MKKWVFAAVACFLVGCSSVPLGLTDIVYTESRPQKAIIYNSGEIVLEDRIEGGRIVNRALALPLSLNLNTVTISQGGRRINYYVITKKTVMMRGSDDKPYSAERYLVTVPGYDGSAELVLRYSVTGISWQPRLDIEVVDGKVMKMYLNAIINPGKNELQNCDITLVHSGSSLKTASSGDTFNIGKINLSGGQLVYFLLDSKAVDYQSYYSWDTGRGPEINSVMAFRNPFTSVINEFPYVLTSNNIVIDEGRIPSVLRDGLVELITGVESKIITYRSITTKEDKQKTVLAFTHDIVYTVESGLESDVIVKVYYEKRIGSVHRNVYRFTTEPDAKPGPYFIWNLNLHGSELKDIAFNFDTDDKQYDDYFSYDHSDIGR